MAKRHVIIGNSGAALAAANAIREHSRDPVLIISSEKCPAYCPVLVPYYVSGELSYRGMFLCNNAYYRTNQFQTILGKAVTKVEPNTGKIYFEDGSIEYDRLLIATGSRMLKPPIPGSDLPGVYTARTESDARQIKDALKQTNRVVIIGAGLIGLRMMDVFHHLNRQVTVVEIEQRIARAILNSETSAIVEDRIRKAGIDLFCGTKVLSIEEALQGKAIHISSGDTLETDLIIMATGITPNTSMVDGTDIKLGHGIVVDEFSRTNLLDIYAAGDVTETFNPLVGKYQLNPTWINAVLQGRIAGLNMAGVRVPLTRWVRANTISILGLPVASVGVITEESKNCHTLINRDNGCYRCLYFNGERLVGAMFLGDVDEAGIIADMIERSATCPTEVTQFRILDIQAEFYASKEKLPETL